MHSENHSKQEGKARKARMARRYARALFRRECVWVLLLIFAGAGRSSGSAVAQDAVSPDATPRITRVQPSQAVPGSQLSLTIEGERFAKGVYVSFSDPAIHVLATRRLNDQRLEVDVAIGDKASPAAARLYVANPSGASGETTFAVVFGTPATSPVPAPVAGTAPPAQPQAAGAGAPEISSIEPSRVAAGSQDTLKITGKKFVPGTKVAFANAGIRVLKTDFRKSSQLAVQIEVAQGAAVGKSSLYVVNPDESEVEASIEVTGTSNPSAQGSSENPSSTASPTNTQASPATQTPSHPQTPEPSSKAGKKKANSGKSETFSVVSLGDAIDILRNPGKPRGSLILAGGKLTYQQDGKDIFVAAPGEVKEVAPNLLFGINTGTFHIILSSGKRYNFVAASLKPADTEAMVAALQKAFPQ